MEDSDHWDDSTKQCQIWASCGFVIGDLHLESRISILRRYRDGTSRFEERGREFSMCHVHTNMVLPLLLWEGLMKMS